MDIAESSVPATLRTARTLPANRVKFVAGGVLIIAAIVYLIWSSATASAQYFLTVDEI